MVKRTSTKTLPPSRRRRRRHATVAEEIKAAAARITAENDDDDEEEDDDGTSIVDQSEAQILAEFGANEGDKWDIRIFRHTGQRTGKPPYLFSCTPDELPVIERLRDVYGSGNYQARVYKNGTLFKQLMYSIEAPPAPKVPLPGGGTTDAGGAIAAMIAQQNANFERLLERMAPNGQPMTAQEQMTANLAMIREMRDAMGVAPAASAGLSPADVISLLKQGMEFGASAAGERSGPTGVMDLIGQMLKSPVVERLLEGVARSLPAMPPGTAPAQLPSPGIGEPLPRPQAPLEAAPPAEQQQTAMLIGNLRYLTTKAAQDADVELYADWTLDNVPEEVLRQIVAQPDAVAILEGVEPSIGNYRDWFGRLAVALADALTAPDPDANSEGHVH